MNCEIESTVNLLEYIINLGASKISQEKLESFKFYLIEILREKFLDTNCDSNNPLSDSDIRELRIHYNLPFPIELACKLADIDENLLKSNLPRYMTIKTNPNSVIFQIGENGPECRLFQSQLGLWKITGDENVTPKENLNPLISTIEERVIHYINFKTKYQPWDNRRLVLEDFKIDIHGNKTPYVYYEDPTPSLILENENILQWENFKHFSKWFKKGKILPTKGETFHEFTHYECINEFISQLNGDPPSNNLKLHQDYIDNTVYWEKQLKRKKYLNNLYWDSTNN